MDNSSRSQQNHNFAIGAVVEDIMSDNQENNERASGRDRGAVYFFWSTLSILVLLCIVIWFFGRIGDIIGYFAAAGAIAYILNPAVEAITARRVPRSVAIMIMFLVLLGGITAAIMLIIPPAVNQFNMLADNIPRYFDSMKVLWEKVVSLSQSSNMPVSLEEFPQRLAGDMQNVIMNAGRNIFTNIAGFFSGLATLVIVPILVYYFLKDGPKVRGAFLSYIPARYRDETGELLSKMNVALGGFIRGQLKLCLAMGVLTFVSLIFLPGMEYELIFGLIAGITEFIPYLGPLLALIGPLIFATTVSWQLVSMVLLLFVVIQLIEGNLLAPRIIGKDVDMHPAMIMLVLMAGGRLGGIVGMIAAIPATVILKVLFDHFYVGKVIRPSEAAQEPPPSTLQNSDERL